MSAKEISIRNAWARYEAQVLSANASTVQRVETQRAFWAGASSLFFGILGSLSPGEEATDADPAVFDRLKSEIEAFYSTLAAEVSGSKPS